MALRVFPVERFHLAGTLAHNALVNVEDRVAQILRGQEKATILRHRIEQRDVRFAIRRQRAVDPPNEASEGRASANRARAHRTVMRTTEKGHSQTTEGLPGAPRSGSA